MKTNSYSNQVTGIVSLAAMKVSLSFEGHSLGGGTAFFYELDGVRYLVTNWHNVTGLNPLSRECLHPKGGLPDAISIQIPCYCEETSSVRFQSFEISLFFDDDRLKPIWWEHPTHKEKVDLVAIPWAFDSEGMHVISANSSDISHDSLGMSPGMDVFTLGFPRLMDGGGLAIWKRGSIATEPGIDVDGLPKILIDTATREGMSGSPVFASGLVSFRETGRQLSSLAIRKRFIGIYSGRVGDDTFLAQLGMVWKESAIIETIRGKMAGTSPF